MHPEENIPNEQPSGTAGPPRPPKKTARDLGDSSPEHVPVGIPDPVAVKDLARALARSPAQVIAELMVIGHFTTNVETLIGFDTAATVVRYFGYEAQKIG